MNGPYWGKILCINLSKGSISQESLDENIFRDFLGGYGLAVRYIFENQKGGVDPLGEENILAFAPGLLSGTGIPFSSRCAIAAKSPLTGTWGDSNFGGFMAEEIRKAGYDAIFIRGKSHHPVYLWIKDNKAELRSAERLWGKDTYQAQEIIREETGEPRAAIASIGPAGEKGSLLSCIIHDEGRAAGRSGLGAVMGSKNLKAIAIKGNQEITLMNTKALERIKTKLYISCSPDPGHLDSLFTAMGSKIAPRLGKRSLALVQKLIAKQNMGLKMWHEFGTSMGLARSVSTGDAPIKNWNSQAAKEFPKEMAAKISDRNVVRFNIDKYACASCPVACGAVVSSASASFPVTRGRRPEYEALAGLGSQVLNSDIESLIKAYDLCNRYGMDVIETGTTISLAMEFSEKGLISKEKAQGFQLRWGNGKELVKLVELMGKREGFGALLADGVAIAANHLSPASKDGVIHIHGQSPGFHHPQVSPSLATSFVADPTPGRHTAGNRMGQEMWDSSFPLKEIKVPSPPFNHPGDRGQAQKILSNWAQVIHCLGLCVFSAGFGELPYMDLVNVPTGWDLSQQELLLCGERIQTLRHLFNVREGLRPKDFILPSRLLTNEQAREEYSIGIKEYYLSMGWNPETGAVNEKELKILGLEKLV